MSILQPEASIWYVTCWLVVGARFVSKRIRRRSWRNLQVDDYLIVPAMMTMTVLFGLMHIIVHTNSNLIAPGDDISKWTSADFKERVYGSKLTIIVEQMQILTIWTLKTCILIMYSRMTDLLRLHIVVKAAAVYVALGFVVMEILWFGVWCRPFPQYWAVPTNSIQCSAMINHLITNAVLNISSDVIIMAIPLPLVFKVKLPWKNKIILCGIFMLGSFTIFAAAKNKYESFKDPFSTHWMIWYLREAFTAMLCANLPLTRPILQRLFNLGDWTQPPTVVPYDSDLRSRSRFSAFRLAGESRTQGSTQIKSGHSKLFSETPGSPSEEYFNYSSAPLEILYETEIRIERHPRDDRDVDELSIAEAGMDDQPNTDSTDARSTTSRPRSVITACYYEPNQNVSSV